jgi:hypothetical protein
VPESAQTTTFVVVGCNTPERLAVYIVKGQKDEVIKAAQTLHQWFTITSLTAAPSQTANPWNGTLLEQVAFTHPVDAFDSAIRYAGFHLRDLPEHQRESAIERAVNILDQAAKQSRLQQTFRPSITFHSEVSNIKTSN